MQEVPSSPDINVLNEIDKEIKEDKRAIALVLQLIRDGWLDRCDFEDAFKFAEEEMRKEGLELESALHIIEEQSQ